jgi:hypothetical protein
MLINMLKFVKLIMLSLFIILNTNTISYALSDKWCSNVGYENTVLPFPKPFWGGCPSNARRVMTLKEVESYYLDGAGQEYLCDLNKNFIFGLTQRRDDYKAIKEMFLYKQDTVKRKCEEFFKANLEVKKDKKYSKKTNSNSIKSSVALDEANKKASKLERKLAALESKQKQEQQQSQPKIVVATKSKSEFPNKSINVNFKSIRKKRDDIAVIIGNANYKKQGKDIPNVNPAYADAEGIKQYFMKAKGIKEGNIIYLKDATNAQLLSVFGNEKSHKGKLFNYIKPKKSNVYIYYAGHGAPGEEGDAYLVPTDTDSQTIQFTGYQLSTLYSNLGKLPAKSVTIILEACFSGGSQSGSLISKASPINITPKKTMIPANVKVIAAGSERQMASWEQDSSHSLFTKYFLKAMSGEGDVNKDGKVSDAELKEYLSDTMTYYARRYYGRDQKVQIHNGG